MKRVFYVLLILVLVGTAMLAFSSCGDSGELTYTLNEDRESYSVSGLGTHTGNHVYVSDTYNDLPVTGIGEFAFWRNEVIKNITIPDSVTNIAKNAFVGCSNLKSVSIGSGVTRIEEGTFSSCASLESVTLSDKITYIGEGAFSSCSSLRSINLPNSITQICFGAFRNCSSLTDVIIPRGLTSIEAHVFDGCSSLKNLTIPSSVTFISVYAFSGCTSISNLYIEDLSAWCRLSFFDEAKNVSVFADNMYLNGQLITNLVIPEDITTIPNGAFYSCTSIKTVTIPKHVTAIGSKAFDGCSSIEEIYFYAQNAADLTYYGYPFNQAGANGKGITVTIGKNVQRIPANLFYTENGTAITNLVFEEDSSCTEIGNNAFTGCKFKSFTLPDSIKSIGSDAFAGCSLLISASLGNGVESIGSNAFRSCISLRSISVGSSLKQLDSSAFVYVTRLIEIINHSTFNIEIENVDVHSGKSKLVFQNDYLFYSFNDINYLVGYIGDDKELTLPSSYNGGSYEIYQNTFMSTDIVSVTIGNGVTKIGYGAFNNCANLATLVMGDNVVSIGSLAFCDCISLESIAFGQNLEEIGAHAFQYCSNIKRVILGSKITIINDYAFGDCDSITDIYYRGSSEDWKKITIESGNNWLTDAARHCGYKD